MNVNYPPEVGQVLAMIGLFEYPLAAALTGTNALAETPIGIIGPGNQGIQIGTVQVHPAAALTSDATNNATITVNKRTAAAPGTPVAIAVGVTAPSGANSTGSWVQWKAVSLTTAAGAFVSPGDTITVAIAKSGAGVTVPISEIVGFTTVS